jgi:transposase
VISVEDWAEIRRLHRAEGVPIKEIVRRLGVARNTVRAALASDEPPVYSRAASGSLADAVEPRVRELLRQFPRMPATVIAERIGWEHSITTLKDRVRQIRPEYAGVDPADRIVHRPGAVTQCDLWFPEPKIPVGFDQSLMLPVLVMTLTYSKLLSAVMIPSRQAGDILAGMWQLIAGVGKVSKTLLWDRESSIGGTGKVTAPAASFAGTLATRFQIAPRRDPEFKGMVERNNEYFETSFLPGREFVSPQDFNTQLADWLPIANRRKVRSLGGRPVEVVGKDLAVMTPLPPIPPVTGLRTRVRLARDYYVRIDSVDYSVHPRVIGRLVDVTATLSRVVVTCGAEVVADHPRCWAKRVTVTDPAHVAAAKVLRRAYSEQKRDRERELASTRNSNHSRAGGHTVAFRALPDYDEMFGVDFRVDIATGEVLD